MHILHGTWQPDTKEFVLWGEDTTRDPLFRKGRRGNFAPHPFPTSIEDLLRYLDTYSTSGYPNGARLTIWLPGHGKNVQPSPEALAAGLEPLDQDLSLLGWNADALTFSIVDAVDFLLQVPGRERGFALGSDLIFWQQATLLAMNCLVEGRYIPALEQRGSQYNASWQARPDDALQAQLSANMPALCRAVVAEPQQAASANALLEGFLHTAVDVFIRDASAQQRQPRQPWLKALTGESNILANTPEHRKLYTAWQEWQALDGGSGAFRVCFRLKDPPKDSDTWQLDYLLQARDDPSLLVEAQKVWKGEQQAFLERRFAHPQEKLLVALGLASRIFGPIEQSLHSARPTGMALNSQAAFDFMIDALPLLEASGFAVLIPNWWGQRARLKARGKLKAQSNEPTGILTRDALVNYQWELSLSGEPINREDFEQLVALKQPLVRYRGEWIALDPGHLEEVKRFFDQSEVQEGEITLLDALKMVADVDGKLPADIEIEETQVEGWLDDLLKRLRDPEQATVPELPQNIRATLRPYQARGFGWLAQMRTMGLGACLADDMGLGKTLQTIVLWEHERAALNVDRPALLVCPTSVVGNWQHEINRFAPGMKTMRHRGADRLRGEDFIRHAEKVDVVLTSYALLHRDLETLQQIQWSSLVLDEAQNIKNPSTKQAQAARSLEADHRIALTGTPVENRLTELWSILHFLNRGYLGSQKAFRSQFSTPIERYRDQAAAETLKKLTAPFILRRVKTDPNVIQDLPEKFENKVYCTLSPEQATLYEATVREEMEIIEEADDDLHRRGNILRMLTRLKQICNHPAHFLKEGEGSPLTERSGKLDRMVEMLEEVREAGERSLIFTQYAEMGTLLQGFLQDYLVDATLFLYGGTPAKKREDMVRLFQSPNGPSIFILSLKAGGTGLNLTNANHVFHFDRWYNPAVENQATDRAFRIGQTKNVQVHKFICMGTLEEHIDELIEHKKDLADQIVGQGENWISELSDNDLRDLVTLRRQTMEG
jgi:SNF2 family DNA or RNA helicase